MSSNKKGRPADMSNYIDVRTCAEFAAGHLPGSVNMPLDEIERRAATLEPEASYVLVCRTGRRAELARNTFQRLGLRASILEGGIAQCRPEQLVVEQGAKEVLSLDRQVQLTIGLLLLISSLCTLFVDKLFVLVPLLIASGLTFAGLTGTCGLAIVLSKLPWNRRACGR